MKNNIYKWLLLAVLLLATAAAYWQISNSEFVNFDDPQYIYENPKVMMGLTWDSIKWAFTKVYASNWHPLTWISLMLDWELFGKNAGGFHLVNLGFHLVNTLLLYILLKKSTKLFWPSFFVSAFFALHPLHVESVAWVVERKDVLSTLFWLLTMIAYVWYTQKISVKRYLPVAAFFILGLMSKPMLVTLPIILLLWDFWPLGRINFNDERRQILKKIGMLALEKLPLIIITIISCAATLYAQKKTVAPFDAFPLWVRIQNALFSCTMYLAQTFWPVDMAVFYPHQESFLEFWKALVAGIILLAVSVIIYKYRDKWRYCVTGWLWYLIALLPVIGLVQVGAQARADRYTYVPLIGFFTAGCFLVYSLTSGKKKLSAAAIVFGFAVCAVLGVVTYKQVGYWKNNFTLFNHALDVTGGSGMAYNNLGVAYAEKGQFEDAERYFNLALTLSNTDYESNYNIAKMLVGLKRYPEAKMYIDKLMTWNGNTGEVYNLYVDYMRGQGDMKNAEKVYIEAIIREPNDATLHYGYGVILADMKRYDDAIMEFIKSIDLQPTTEAFVDLGAAMISKGDVNGGILHFEAALKIDRKNANAYYHLGNAYLTKQSFEKAVDNFKMALQNDPNYFRAHGNLAVSLAQMGKLDEAIEHMQKVTTFDPNNPDGYFNLGLALMDAKRYKEAQVPLEALTKLDPNNPDNYIYLGNAFYEQKDLENAAKAYQKALSIDPNYPKAKEGLQKISSGR